jgi:2-dehydro-3-deoxyphosphogluconate aldolase / (4S)-4-hydroxy-2-oxoglutarate aldolase
MDKKYVLAKIEELGIVPCARVKVGAQARFAAEVLYAAGLPVLEIALTLPDAPKVIEEIAKQHPDLVLGAGTVLDEQEARQAIEAGACFLTSPGFIPEVVNFAKKANIAVFPGALTPTEVIAAWKAGGDFIKIFPAGTAGGSHFVRALKVPLPQVPLIVTGGVNQLTAFDYILAGATAIGVGSELLPKDALRDRQQHRIRELARRFLHMVNDAREQLEEG